MRRSSRGGAAVTRACWPRAAPASSSSCSGSRRGHDRRVSDRAGPAPVDVDAYINAQLVGADPVLDAALARAAAAGLPAHDVAPTQGKLLPLLARIRGARTILELGTLAGYSTIWLARALPAGGRLITLEVDPRYAEVARRNLAGFDAVEVIAGPALEALPRLTGPF